MAGFTISLPLYIELGIKKKKNIYLNYNKLNNLHYQQRNQLKQRFTVLISKELSKCPTFNKQIKITYTVYKPTKRRYDVMNVVAVMDKFFQDVLVKNSKIQDDNYTVVPLVVGKHGGIDKENPRVDVLIEEMECGVH